MTAKAAIDPRLTRIPADQWCRRKIGKGRVCRTRGDKKRGGACSLEHQRLPRCCGGASRQGTAADGWPADCTAVPTAGAPGERCKWHGGAAHPGGPDHHSWKGGRHSKFLPAGIRERFDEAWADPDLTRIRQDMAALDAILTGHYLRIKDQKMPTLQQEKRILALVEQRRRLAGEETKRQAAMHQSVSLLQFLSVMRVVGDLFREYVADDDKRRQVQIKLNRLLLAKDETIDGDVVEGGGDGGGKVSEPGNDTAPDPGGDGPAAKPPGNH